MMFKQIIATAINRHFNKSDIDRWGEVASLNKNWNDRTKLMSSFIDSNTKSVIEFGCAGKELEGFIPQGVSYMPSDIVDRGGCLVCDLNQEIPNLEQYDTVFLSGVIEYINDVSELLNVISSASGVKTVIVSYATKEKNRRRLSQGWVNSYSKDEFEFLFNDRGFSISHQDSWQKQNIYKFTRNKTC